jgi:hypothetical protein
MFRLLYVLLLACREADCFRPSFGAAQRVSTRVLSQSIGTSDNATSGVRYRYVKPHPSQQDARVVLQVRNSQQKKGSAASIALNKEITKSSSWEVVMKILKEAHPKDINAVNAATALYKISKISHKSRPSKTQLDFVATLVESKIGEFNAQGLANTIWAYATLGLTPSDRVQKALSDAVLRLAGEFNAQNVANTIWAYAALGLTPSDRVQKALSDAVLRLAGEFNAQNVANTIWAYAVLRFEPQAHLLRCASALSNSFSGQELVQISYVYLVGQALGWSFKHPLPVELAERALAAHRRCVKETHLSKLQTRVYEALQDMGAAPQSEHLTEDGLFSIDVALLARDGLCKVAVEVDGPTHFSSSGAKMGSTCCATCCSSIVVGPWSRCPTGPSMPLIPMQT